MNVVIIGQFIMLSLNNHSSIVDILLAVHNLAFFIFTLIIVVLIIQVLDEISIVGQELLYHFFGHRKLIRIFVVFILKILNKNGLLIVI